MKQRRERQGVSMTSNGPPPEAAAALYVGDVMHQRMKPFGHRFRYRVFSMAIDLDRLEEANGLSMLFSVNRRNAVSFFERDHGGDKSVRAHADALLAQAGLTPSASCWSAIPVSSATCSIRCRSTMPMAKTTL
jgi:DUF1365 family protein